MYRQDLFAKRFMMMDGIKLDASVLPAPPSLQDMSISNNTHYHNLGNIATHEIGHWMGLFHVFFAPWTPDGHIQKVDPCLAKGDNIADTPPQAFARSSCDMPQENYNSCPRRYGFDSRLTYSCQISKWLTLDRCAQSHGLHSRCVVSAPIY